MDPANASKPYTLNRADGTSLEFDRLSPSDRIRYRNEFRHSRKLKKVQNLTLTGATPKEIREELDAFDAKRLPESEVERWVLDPEGQFVAVMMSLQRKTPNADAAAVEALGLMEGEWLDVAAGVVGVKLVYGPVESEKKPDPTTAGTEPTGDTTPTS